MAEVLPLMNTIQDHILGTFAHWQLRQTAEPRCQCSNPSLFRCVDCFKAPMWCRACIVTAHRYNPFHHIERWDGKMFVRDSLCSQDSTHHSLCLQTDVKSGTTPCRHAPRNNKFMRFTICDHNGFHTRDIQLCYCEGAGETWEQLLKVRLFPATFKAPQTAFTFAVLKQFLVHSLASKKSAYDFVKALGQLTNNSDPDSVSVSSPLPLVAATCY